jgi:hypothetical protein
MRALVISDTHFGPWTGRELLREWLFLERLAPALEEIDEPDLDSRQAYARYLRYAWPGTAILIDADAPAPQLIEMLADLNPLNGGPGLPPPR